MPVGSESLGSAVLELSTNTGAFTRQMATARQTATAGFNQMQSGANALGATLKRVFTFTAAIAGVRALVRSISDATGVFAGFEQSLANVQSVARATPQEFAQLERAARSAGEATRFTASEAADALYYLASAGMDANQSMNALSGVLNLAGATQSDLAFTSEAVASSLSQFNLEAKEAERVANVFTAAIQNSQATMDKLASSMSYVGPVASGLGYTLEEVAGSLQILYNAGIDGSTAGTALRSIFSQLANEMSPAVMQLEKMGIAFEDVNPAANKFSDIVDVLRERGVTAGEAMAIFGERAGPAMIKLLQEGGDAIDAYTDAVTGTNAAAEAYAIQMDTLAGSMDTMKSAAESVKISLVDTFSPIMRSAVDSITEALRGISGWLTENRDRILNFWLHFPEIVQESMTTVVNIMGQALTARYLIYAAGVLWQTVVDRAKTALDTIWAVIKAVGAQIWEPLKVGFEWVAYAIQQAWRSVFDFITELMNGIITGINGMLDAVETLVNKVADAEAFIRHPFNPEKREERAQGNYVDIGSIGLLGAPNRTPLERPGGYNNDIVAQAWSDAITQFGTLLKDNNAITAEMWRELLDPFGVELDDFVTRFNEIINQDLPEAFRSAPPGGSPGQSPAIAATNALIVAPAFQGIVEGIGDTLTTANLQFTNLTRGMQPFIEELIGYSKAVDSAAQAVEDSIPAWDSELSRMGGNPDLSGMGRQWDFGITAEALDTLTGAITSAIPQFATLGSAAGILSVLLEGFVGAVGGILEGPLAYIFGILKTQGAFLGQVLAPIFKFLGNVVEFVAKGFVWLYNSVWVPVGNALQVVFQIILTILWAFGQAITSLVNALIKLYNAVRREAKELNLVSNPFGDAPPEIGGTIKKIKLEDLANAGAEDANLTGDAGGGGGGATFQQQRPIEVTINVYDNNVYGGSLQEFVLMLRDEWEAVAELGI